MTPGDFILVHGDGFFDRIIQFGQLLRFSKKNSYYNHAALVISSEGDLIEAIGTGVKQTHISKYTKDQYKYIEINAAPEDQQEIITFAKSRLNDGYGWMTIVSCAFCLLFGLKFSFGFSGEDICSGLVTRALERGRFIPSRDPENMTPADLTKYYVR